MQRLLILSLPLCLCACATTEVVATGGTCNSWQSIYISKNDQLTDGTAKQIEGNNLARQRVCKKEHPNG